MMDPAELEAAQSYDSDFMGVADIYPREPVDGRARRPVARFPYRTMMLARALGITPAAVRDHWIHRETWCWKHSWNPEFPSHPRTCRLCALEGMAKRYEREKRRTIYSAEIRRWRIGIIAKRVRALAQGED